MHCPFNFNKCNYTNTAACFSVFTIRFRSFSPMPNALEFHSGQSYYFISTSSPLNYTTRVGGYCRTNNMKVDT